MDPRVSSLGLSGGFFLAIGTLVLIANVEDNKYAAAMLYFVSFASFLGCLLFRCACVAPDESDLFNDNDVEETEGLLKKKFSPSSNLNESDESGSETSSGEDDSDTNSNNLSHGNLVRRKKQ